MKIKPNHAPAVVGVYQYGRVFLAKEPALVVYNTKTAKITAIGEAVEKLEALSPDEVCISPFYMGGIDDFTVATAFMKYLLKKTRCTIFRKPNFLLCIPKDQISEVARKAYSDLIYCSGARAVTLYGGSYHEALKNMPDKDLKQFTHIMEITTSDFSEYAKELAAEAANRIKYWGISKADFIRMLEESEI